MWAGSALTEIQDEPVKIALHLMRQARLKRSLQEVFRWLNEHYGATIDPQFFRLLLLYALHTDISLDYQKLVRETLTNQNLRNQAMTTAALLKAEGKAMGRLLGAIATLESILNLPVTPTEALESMTQSELEAVLQKLQAKYRERIPEPK